MNPRNLSRIQTRLFRFGKAEGGAVTPLIGLMMLVLVGSTGIAVDIGRSMVVKARLVNALDAAGLAVGARLGTSDFSADAKKFVSANFSTDYAGATVKDVVATANDAKSVITLSATAEMPTAFMRLFGTDLVTVRATSEVTRAAGGLELVLALDNTGSMATSNSMPTLIAAANELVDGLFAGTATSRNLYVGLVPFSQTVNIGTTRAGWTYDDAARPGYPARWTGCVEARQGGEDKTDTPPTSNATKFRTYQYPDDYSYAGPSGSNDWMDTGSGGGGGWGGGGWGGGGWGGGGWGGGGSGGGNQTEPTYTINYAANPPQGPGAFCPREVTPMTNVKQTIIDGIAGMNAIGHTHVNLGAVWGWRMLSPKWRGLWGGDMDKNALPLAYNTRGMTKALVLMTDGANTFEQGLYTAYGKLSDGRLGATNSHNAEQALDDRLAKVCTDMKAQGILIYTVAFAVPDQDTKTLLQNCATNINLAFDASNKPALISAFADIADSLIGLRVSR